MKKIFMPFLLLMIALVTITSCKKDEKDDKDKDKDKIDMIGLYSGNVKTNSSLQITYPGVLALDTTFTTLASTAEIKAHPSTDSLNLEIKLTLDGNAIKIKVPAYKTNDSTITITNYPYTYIVVNMLVNGEATLDGDDLTADIQMSNGAGNPTGTIIVGDLTFTGAR